MTCFIGSCAKAVSGLIATGVGTKAVFGHEMRFDLQAGFPVITTKKVFWRTAFREMLWMLSGATNIRPLLQQKCRIWSDWPYKKFISGLPSGSPERLMSIEEFEAKIVA